MHGDTSDFFYVFTDKKSLNKMKPVLRKNYHQFLHLIKVLLTGLVAKMYTKSIAIYAIKTA
jgi:hypothetical protein